MTDEETSKKVPKEVLAKIRELAVELERESMFNDLDSRSLLFLDNRVDQERKETDWLEFFLIGYWYGSYDS